MGVIVVGVNQSTNAARLKELRRRATMGTLNDAVVLAEVLRCGLPKSGRRP